MGFFSCVAVSKVQPFRKAYNLCEAAKLCMITKYDITDLARHGEIRLHVWIPLTLVEESREVKSGKKIFFENKQYSYEGYLPLYPSDVRKVIKYEHLNIRCFPGENDNCRILLLHGTPNFEIYKNDLKILKEDLFELQKFLGVEPQPVDGVKIIGHLGDLLQNDNHPLARYAKTAQKTTFDRLFQSITFQGKNFNFGLIQSSIIKQLYDAHQKGHPRVHFKILLENAGANCMYMRDIFKSQENWKDIICTNQKGYYWLHEDFFRT